MATNLETEIDNWPSEVNVGKSITVHGQHIQFRQRNQRVCQEGDGVVAQVEMD